jgi:TolB protein
MFGFVRNAMVAVIVSVVLGAQQIRPAESDAIVFDSERDGQAGIFVMDADGNKVRRVLLTPSGKDSAFASNRDGLWDIYVIRADGTALRRLTQTTVANGGDEPENDSPDWSPDGKQIAFRSGLYGAAHIDVMNADGSNRRALTPPELRASFPAWSPDGLKLAFACNQVGKRDIYVMNADGSEARPITHSPAPARTVNGVAWSPDGKRILFDSRWGGDWDIWVVNADGSDQRQLTRVGADTARAAWSPDGKRIAFHSTRDRPTGNQNMDYEIYVMDSDGSNVRRLTSNKAFDAHPDWR